MPLRCIVLLVVLFAVPTALCEFLPVVNPSFEDLSRPLAVGEQTNGAGGAGVLVGTRLPFMGGAVSYDNPVEVPGWRTFLPPPENPGAVIRAGVLRPPPIGPEQLPFITGQDGENIAAAQVAAIQQTLNVLLQPNMQYRLDFLAGIGRFDTQNGVYVALVASPDLETIAYPGRPDVTTLVQTQGIVPPASTFGTLLPYSIEYTTPAVLPARLVGRYVAISAIGSDGIPRTCFDNFRLEATPVPEPAAVVPLIAAGMVLGRRRSPW